MDPETRLSARYEKLRALGNGLTPLEPVAGASEAGAATKGVST